MKSLPRYLLIVLALAGDSTITSDLPIVLFAPKSLEKKKIDSIYRGLRQDFQVNPSFTRLVSHFLIKNKEYKNNMRLLNVICHLMILTSTFSAFLVIHTHLYKLTTPC
jgi:hypothetical protein